MIYKIWLLIINISNNIKIELLQQFKDEEEIFKNFQKIFNCNTLFKNKKVHNIKEELIKAEKILDFINKNNISVLFYNDEDYPTALKQINEPPYGLFYKGNISLLNNRIVAIVGSRYCSNYGIEVTKLLTNNLNSFNITIISGGAKGIDTVSHRTSLNCNGNTIVVLGCGIDIAYPYENFNLFKQIEKEGLIISEFSPGTKPYGYNFPRRNRIISGLSELVIVVEASIKSGSLITATLAAEQGREVMAVPGSILYKGSEGCNKLISEGAEIITSLDDVYVKMNLHKRTIINNISPIKGKILSILQKEPIHINDILKKSCIDREVLFKVLFEMQIGNEIVFLPGDYYARII
ncbi:MAG: DNA-protecting protein DprA [Clostridiales bacterium]|nr:DNA-protecting protein DprA [Clostridiales bacterium]